MNKLTFWIAGILMLLACHQPQYTHLGDFLSAGNLAETKNARMIQISSHDTTGGNNDRINIKPGETATIFNVKGPGAIARIWVTIDSRDPWYLRRILLRMYWDDEKTPSVECPVGDFFGNGFQYRHYTAQYLGMSSGGFYCYFPMPFNRSARIEVVNETGQEVYAFYYQIGYFEFRDPLTPSTAYFHARWNREIRTSADASYTILEAVGKGHFTGCNLQVEPFNKSFWYLEGDERVYIDGETNPSMTGTGTEDYFNGGWYYKDGEFAAPFHGLIFKDEVTKRTVAYRHHIPDPIPFEKSIRFTIEHGHANEEIVDMASVAYWYQTEPHNESPPIAKAGLRIPLRAIVPNGCIEAENLFFRSDEVMPVKEDMSEYGPDWSNHHQLRVGGHPGDHFELVVTGLYEPCYHAEIFYTEGPEYGIAEVKVGNHPIVTFDSYSHDLLPGKKIILKTLKTEGDCLTFNFRFGSQLQPSTGTDLGIDAIRLIPVRNFIPAWNLIGPFPNRRESDYLRYGLDEIFPPETETDFAKKYAGAEGQEVSWKVLDTPEGGYFSLWNQFNPYEFVVCYACSFIHSPVGQTVPLLLGSDDGSKVVLNRQELYRFLDVRIAAPDQDTVLLALKPGWNQLMLKIENNFGGYAFYARIIDKQGNLKYSTRLPD